jgi:O-antigen/teichoic acid export membrane protein
MKLQLSPILKKYGNNILWLLSERFFGLGVGLIVSILMARYLGPEQYGMLNYIVAFVALLMPLGRLGLDGVISRDIAVGKQDVGELLSSAFFLKVIGSTLLLIFSSLYMFYTKEQLIYVYISIFISLSWLVRSFDVISFFYRAKVKGKFIVVSQLSGVLLSSCLKILFIYLSLPLVYFSIAYLFDAVVFSTVICFLFYKEGIKFGWVKVNIKKSINLIKETWPLIFGGVFAQIYMNIDQVMLGEMVGNEEVGYYSVAAKLSSLVYAIVPILSWTFQTSIVNAKKNSEKLYFERLRLLSTFLMVVALFTVIPICVFADEIVALLYGDTYSSSSEILFIHCLSVVFVLNRLPRTLYILNESFFKFTMAMTFMGAISNVLLNYLVIPEYGGVGAAWSTLISYSIAFFFSGFLFNKTVAVAKIQARGLLLLDIKQLYGFCIATLIKVR